MAWQPAFGAFIYLVSVQSPSRQVRKSKICRHISEMGAFMDTYAVLDGLAAERGEGYRGGTIVGGRKHATFSRARPKGENRSGKAQPDVTVRE